MRFDLIRTDSHNFTQNVFIFDFFSIQIRSTFLQADMSKACSLLIFLLFKIPVSVPLTVWTTRTYIFNIRRFNGINFCFKIPCFFLEIRISLVHFDNWFRCHGIVHFDPNAPSFSKFLKTHLEFIFRSNAYIKIWVWIRIKMSCSSFA